MDPQALLEDYLAHRVEAPRPFSDALAPRRLLAEPVDQPLTQALVDHQPSDEPAGRTRKRIA